MPTQMSPTRTLIRYIKPHLTFLPIITDQKRSGADTFNYAFFNDSTDKFIHIVSSFVGRAIKRGRIVATPEKGG